MIFSCALSSHDLPMHAPLLCPSRPSRCQSSMTARRSAETPGAAPHTPTTGTRRGATSRRPALPRRRTTPTQQVSEHMHPLLLQDNDCPCCVHADMVGFPAPCCGTISSHAPSDESPRPLHTCSPPNRLHCAHHLDRGSEGLKAETPASFGALQLPETLGAEPYHDFAMEPE